MRQVMGMAAVCALALTVGVAAQDTTKKPAAAEHTMSGCVQKGATATTGTLQNTAEKGPKTIGVVESKDEPRGARRPQGRDHGRQRARGRSGSDEARAGQGGSLHEAERREDGLSHVPLSSRQLRNEKGRSNPALRLYAR